MNFRSVYVSNLAAANLSATGSGTEADITKYFVSPARREMMATLTAVKTGAGTDSYLLDVKLQASSTTMDSDFADITSATFTQLNDASTAAPESIYFQTPATAKYIREYHTITNSGAATVATVCNAYLLKRMG